MDAATTHTQVRTILGSHVALQGLWYRRVVRMIDFRNKNGIANGLVAGLRHQVPQHTLSILDGASFGITVSEIQQLLLL